MERSNENMNNDQSRPMEGAARAPRPIMKRKSRTVRISTVEMARQSSIVSDLSSSTSDSKYSQNSFFMDTSNSEDKELKPARATTTEENPRSLKEVFDRMNCLALQDSTLIEKQALKMSCVDEKDADAPRELSTPGEVIVLGSRQNVYPIVTNLGGRVKPHIVPTATKQEASRAGSYQTLFVSYDSGFSNSDAAATNAPKRIRIVDFFKCGQPRFDSAAKSTDGYRGPFSYLVPIISPSKVVASTSPRFLSVSMSMDELSCSMNSIAVEGEGKMPEKGLGKTKMKQGMFQVPTAKESMFTKETTIEDMPFDLQSSTASTPKQGNKGKARNDSEKQDIVGEEDGVLENSAPIAASSLALQSVQSDDFIGANIEAIEVNETGTIVNEDINTCETPAEGHSPQLPFKNVYLSHKIDAGQSEVQDETSLSSPMKDSYEENAKTVSKHFSLLTSFSTPKLKRRLRALAGSRDKKENGFVSKKPKATDCDSPGANTTATILMDGSSFGEEDFSNSNGNQPFQLRPRPGGEQQSCFRLF
ncbi:unnamed protein product [Pseudo-nitzschia multistriata]|uniref:Uncharacterized protein n=1 Tax=Pseudo-nitzschia multistriata TaxID=183589 RepID=A0A448YVA1_9STRA|nr:unnamed protein product [Pseudo-nitzschia multistriata]